MLASRELTLLAAKLLHSMCVSGVKAPVHAWVHVYAASKSGIPGLFGKQVGKYSYLQCSATFAVRPAGCTATQARPSSR